MSPDKPSAPTSWWGYLWDWKHRGYEVEGSSTSLLMLLTAIVMCVLRAVSPTEHVKQLYASASGRPDVPAWFTDLLLMIWWTLSLVLLTSDELAIRMSATSTWNVLRLAPLAVALQVIHVNFFHHFWRSYRSHRAPHIGMVHNRVRTLLIGLGNFGFLVGLFAIAYRWNGQFHTAGGSIDSIDAWTATYFSFVTASTLGYGEFTPADVITQMIVVCQIVCSLFMVAIVLSQAVSAVRPLPERPHSRGTDAVTAAIEEVDDSLHLMAEQLQALRPLLRSSEIHEEIRSDLPSSTPPGLNQD